MRDYNFERGWLTYDREFYVEGDKTAYIYIAPEKYGDYEMDVYVTGRTEWKTVKEHVIFYVASPKEIANEEFDMFGGIVYFFTHPATVMVAIVLSLIIIIYGGTRLVLTKPQPWKT